MSQAADQIQQMVAGALREFEQLSASDQPPSQVLNQMLASLSRATSALGAVAWMPNAQDGTQQPVARAGQAALAFTSDGMAQPPVLDAVNQAIGENKPAIVSPDQQAFASTELQHTTQFYVPMDAAGRAMGAIHVFHGADLDPKVYRQYIAFTQQAARAAGVYLARRQSQVLAEESASNAAMLKVVSRLLDEDKPNDLVHELANAGRPLLHAQRLAAVGYRGRKTEVQFSDAVDTNRKAVLVRSVEMLADTARQRQVPMTFRRGQELEEDDQAMGPMLEDLFNLGAAEAVCITLIRDDDRVVGVLVAEYGDTETADQYAPIQQQLCQQVGPILHRTIEAHHRPLRRTSNLLAKVRRAPMSTTAKAGLIAAVVVAVIYSVFFVPVPMYLRADARLEPAHLAAITAPLDGRVESVHVSTGENVKADQLLVTMDSSDIRLKLAEVTRSIQAEKIKLQASRNKADAPAVRSSELTIDQLEIRKRALTRKLERTQVRSLIDGVVLTERTDQMEGMSIALGEKLVHVADMSSFELVMEVREEDLALVEDALRNGKPVKVDFLSRAWPDRVQYATITELSALSPTSGPDEQNVQHVFRITVPIDLENMSPQLVLANPTGRAKLHVEPASLAYRYGRRVWRFVQMTLLF